MRVWNPRFELGGLEERDVKEASFLLWKGHCSVHQRFRPEHVAAFRAEYPNGEVIVHPECAHDLVELADRVGSTERILAWVEAAEPGSVIGVGTEIHMVQRMAAEHPELTIVSLDPLICPCSTMFRIDGPHLAWVLESLVRGEVVNQITVDEHTTEWARVALAAHARHHLSGATPSGRPQGVPIPRDMAAQALEHSISPAADRDLVDRDLQVRFSPDIFRTQTYGGVSRYITELHRGLIARGIDSRILAWLHINAYLQGLPGTVGLDIAKVRPIRARQALTKGTDRVFERLWCTRQRPRHDLAQVDVRPSRTSGPAPGGHGLRHDPRALPGSVRVSGCHPGLEASMV